MSARSIRGDRRHVFAPVVVLGDDDAITGRTVVERSDRLALLTARSKPTSPMITASSRTLLGIALTSIYEVRDSVFVVRHFATVLSSDRSRELSNTPTETLVETDSTFGLVLDHLHELRDLTQSVLEEETAIEVPLYLSDLFASWEIPVMDLGF